MNATVKVLGFIAYYGHLLVRACICTMNINGVSVCVFMFTLLTAWVLDRLHDDDAVCACGFLHSRGVHPDDCVGQRQTSWLLKGVQRLSNIALLHTPLYPLKYCNENKLLHTHPLPTFLEPLSHWSENVHQN